MPARRQGGGALLRTLGVLLLIGLLVGGYRGWRFYQERLAPAAADAAQVLDKVRKFVPNLNPYKLSRDPAEIGTALRADFGIDPPAGYVGAFGMAVELLGQRHMALQALIPAGAPAGSIFEGGKDEIRFEPGKSTIFLAAKFERTSPEEMQATVTRLASGEAGSAAMQPVFYEARGRKVAALRGESSSYGSVKQLVYVFLDEGRMLAAIGPRDGYDDAALARMLDSLVATHPANVLLYEHPRAPEITAPSDDPCGLPGLKGDFDVVAVTVFKGSTPLDVAIDQSGIDVRREEVVVGNTSKPVVLLLAGHDPIVWNVGMTSGARIAGVLAQGDHRQAVIGLPRAVRVSTYSSADGPNACRPFRPMLEDGGKTFAFERRVRELFGRAPATLLTQKADGRFVVGEVLEDAAYSSERSLAGVTLPDDVLPGGPKGLERLVKRGVTRLATDAEIDAWVRGAARSRGRPYDELRRRMAPNLGNESVYVVLGAFDLPQGLAGADSRTFIVPAGAAAPGGPRGHCTFLFMQDFQCRGTSCF